jgi:hypothetical protein
MPRRGGGGGGVYSQLKLLTRRPRGRGRGGGGGGGGERGVHDNLLLHYKEEKEKHDDERAKVSEVWQTHMSHGTACRSPQGYLPPQSLVVQHCFAQQLLGALLRWYYAHTHTHTHTHRVATGLAGAVKGARAVKNKR